MPVGTEVELDAPYGSFTLHNNVARPAVFLTGGIGITPVRSIVLQSDHDKTGHQIFVFYSNKRPEDAAFLDELGRLSGTNDNITLVATMTAPENSKRTWAGETGVIDKLMISNHIKDLTTPFHLCGPPGMVTAMRNLLNDHSLSSVKPSSVSQCKLSRRVVTVGDAQCRHSPHSVTAQAVEPGVPCGPTLGQSDRDRRLDWR